MMKRWFLILGVGLLSAACQTEYHAYDTRVDGPQQLHEWQLPAIERACRGKQTIRFAVLSDTQRWYDETQEVVHAINARDDIDFVIHGGDMADWGMRSEFERQRDILLQLDVPFVALLGNHDCLATGDLVYRKIFGEPHFAFTAGDVRFVAVNTNMLEFRSVDPVPDFDFLERELTNYPADARRTIALMHAPPCSEQLFGAKADRLHAQLVGFPNLLVAIHGHGHRYAITEPYSDGVVYIQADCIEQRNYLIFTIDKSGYSHEQVYY